MATASPKLPLTNDERSRLRAARLKLSGISTLNSEELAQILSCSDERAGHLHALSIFQTIPSIGPVIAQAVVDLGYYSLDDIRHESGPDLLNRLETLYGYWVDPCVEDCMWCIVYHANHPGSDKSWFAFTDDRKAYRRQHGYPQTRPMLAWHAVKS